MTDIKRLFIDIETGKSPDYEIFKPDFKPPKINKDGTQSKTSKSIEQQESDWKNTLALSPLTGQVLMIGYEWCAEGVYTEWQCSNEDETINEQNLLVECASMINRSDLIIGHYIKQFDLPFIIQRCRKHGITPPQIGYTKGSKWYWNENVIDLSELWLMGNNYGSDGSRAYISLNKMAKFFGFEVKDETIGAKFEETFNEDIEKAIAYCKHDVELTKQIYEKLK
jgi:DNA polymerase elongation subunit (family B)